MNPAGRLTAHDTETVQLGRQHADLLAYGNFLRQLRRKVRGDHSRPASHLSDLALFACPLMVALGCVFGAEMTAYVIGAAFALLVVACLIWPPQA